MKKKKEPMTDNKTTMLTELTKGLIDRGKIIEAGWVSLSVMTIPPDAPPVQLEEMRNAFFAGARHVFDSIMTMLDPGSEPTDRDLQRMESISNELDEFLNDFKRQHPEISQ